MQTQQCPTLLYHESIIILERVSNYGLNKKVEIIFELSVADTDHCVTQFVMNFGS